MDKTFYHTFLLYRIRQNTPIDIVSISKIKEIIGRTTVRKGGFPRSLVRFIIQDLIDMGLIVRVNNRLYRIVQTALEKKIKALVMAIGY